MSGKKFGKETDRRQGKNVKKNVKSSEKKAPFSKEDSFKSKVRPQDKQRAKKFEQESKERQTSAVMESTNEDYIMGRNPVLEALRSNREINKILIAEGSQQGSMQQVIGLAKDKNVNIQIVPKKKIDSLVEGIHQGVIAQVAAYEYAEIEDLFELAAKKEQDPFILILDEIEDPHNLGSIMRTADAVGAHGIIIPKRRAVGLTATVAKASTGAIEHIPVVRVTNIAQAIDKLKENGVWIAGTDAKGSKDYRQMDATLPLGLVIGSEGKGMGRLIKEKCDFLIHLPMVGHVTSLNASVAGGILLYEIFKQRCGNK